MGFRVVIIKDRAKLDLKMNYLVCRRETETRVFIPEIETLILESTSISLTASLISELTKQNVKIIFCDEKHNPQGEILPYYGSYNVSKKINQQFNWNSETKGKLWKEIVRQKILKQSDFLLEKDFKNEAEMLREYSKNIEDNDITNREGHSAKVYFNAIYGKDFSRREQVFPNNALNYGYAILLSMFNREIVRMGYLTQLGIWHKNEFNNFNLSSDLMEPFRTIVDRIVWNIDEGDKEYKLKLLKLYDVKVVISGKKQSLDNAVPIYLQSIFDALNENDINLVEFYELQNYENDNIF